MVDSIRPIFDDKATCIECAIKTALSKWKVDSNYLYVGAFNFGYDKAKELYGQRISCNKYEMFKYIGYQGIKITRKEINDYNELHCLIINEINNKNPIVVHIDTYECPWNELFGKYHFRHYCVITGIDYKKEVYYAYDTYLKEDIVELPFLCLERGYLDYLIFDQCEKYEFTAKDILGDIIQGITQRKMTDSLRLFADELSQNIQLVFREIDLYDNEKYANLLVELAFLRWAREQFMEINKGLFSVEVRELLDNDIELWEKARMLLYKQILIRKMDYSDSLKELFYQIAEFEDCIIDELRKQLQLLM